MEIGSPEHKQLLRKSIIKMAIRKLTFGTVIGIMLMLPSILRENAFSSGLALTGQIIIAITVVYTLVIAFKKYRNTLGQLG